MERLAELTEQQILEFPKSPVWQESKQLTQESIRLRQQLKISTDPEEILELERRLAEIKNRKIESNRQLKEQFNQTVSAIKVLNTFIPFERVAQLQIQRYYLDPLLQALAGNPPNKIVTIHDVNGKIYLVKAQYDPVSNQIFPPI
jgi:hypothetical protein